MPRRMSCSMTIDAVRERRKTVTRRKGWWKDKNGRRIIQPGDHLTLCRKVMGRRPGEPLVRLAEVEVVGILRQPLGRLLRSWRAGAGMTCASAMCGWVATDCEHWRAYETLEMEAEGFPGLATERFVQDYFADAQHVFPDDYVTRIEWRYLDGADA